MAFRDKVPEHPDLPPEDELLEGFEDPRAESAGEDASLANPVEPEEALPAPAHSPPACGSADAKPENDDEKLRSEVARLRRFTRQDP